MTLFAQHIEDCEIKDLCVNCGFYLPECECSSEDMDEFWAGNRQFSKQEMKEAE